MLAIDVASIQGASIAFQLGKVKFFSGRETKKDVLFRILFPIQKRRGRQAPGILEGLILHKSVRILYGLPIGPNHLFFLNGALSMTDISLFEQALSFVLHIDQHLFALVAEYGTLLYLFLFLVVFCETGLVVTPFLPGDSLLFAAGTVAGAGHLSYPVCMLVLLAAAVFGDAVNYEIGRHVGPSIFNKKTRFLNKEHLLKAHAFYERHGGKAIILARFIPIVRTFAPFVAGIALMSPVKFLSFNVTGAVLWVAGLVSAGYFLGNIPVVKNNFSVVIYGIVIISILPVIIEFVRAKCKK